MTTLAFPSDVIAARPTFTMDLPGGWQSVPDADESVNGVPAAPRGLPEHEFTPDIVVTADELLPEHSVRHDLDGVVGTATHRREATVGSGGANGGVGGGGGSASRGTSAPPPHSPWLPPDTSGASTSCDDRHPVVSRGLDGLNWAAKSETNHSSYTTYYDDAKADAGSAPVRTASSPRRAPKPSGSGRTVSEANARPSAVAEPTHHGLAAMMGSP